MSSANYVFVLLCIIPGVIRGQQYVGDKCTLKSTGRQGTCTLLTKCKEALDELNQNRFPQTCGFQGTQPIVCCAQTDQTAQRISGDISKKKCKEYSKFIYEKKKEPTLLIDSTDLVTNECGHKVVKLIVGGEPAERKEFPHMAAVGFEVENNPNNIQWFCGGTIISEEYILTAGHCLYSQEFGPAKHARIGVANLKDNSRYKQDLKISERVPHPEYKSSSHYYDIGLLKLEKRIKINPYTIPACLYSEPEITTKQAIATGWGKTQFLGSGSDDLRKVTLDFYSQQKCNNSYRNQISRKLKLGIVGETQVCAGSEQEKDTCQGDSGGPLQIYHINDDIECMYDVVGVTSFGKGCGSSLGVYTRVSYFVKWIEDTVWPQNKQI